jgi:hypothetical protein
MTIRFEKLKARLLANPRVKAEYDALAPEFEIAAELLRLENGPHAPKHEDAAALCRGDRQQVSGAAIGGVRRRSRKRQAGSNRHCRVFRYPVETRSRLGLMKRMKK